MTDFPTTCKAFAKSIGGRKEAADSLGVSKATFDAYCDGTRKPRPARMPVLHKIMQPFLTVRH